MRDLPRRRRERAGGPPGDRREGHRSSPARRRSIGNAEIAFERSPRSRSAPGTSPACAALAPTSSRSWCRSNSPITCRPGQYREGEIRRLPGARLSPTVRFDGAADGRTRLPHPPLSGRPGLGPDRPRDPPGHASRCAARSAARSCARRRPARADRRRHRLGADLVGGVRRAPRAAPSRARRRSRAAATPNLYMRRSLEWLIERRRARHRADGKRERGRRRHPLRPADRVPARADLGRHGLRRRRAAMVDAVNSWRTAPAPSATPTRSP